MPTAKDIMNILLATAKQYNADMNPKDNIIKFIFPKNDKNNPSGRDVLVEINILTYEAKMSEVKN